MRARSTPRPASTEPSAPSAMPSHRARGRPAGGNDPAPRIATSKAGTSAGRDPDRLGGGFDPLVDGRTEEAKRQVQPIEPDPADVAAAAGDSLPHGSPSTSRATSADGVIGQRHRDEQAASGKVGPGPAGSAGPHPSLGVRSGLALPGHAVGAQDIERLVALAPADDVDGLVLERLVGLEEVLDLDQPVRPDLVERLDVLPGGRHRARRTGP